LRVKQYGNGNSIKMSAFIENLAWHYRK